jgi:hypothetical protein
VTEGARQIPLAVQDPVLAALREADTWWELGTVLDRSPIVIR